MCYESNYTTNCAKSQMNRTVNNLLAYILPTIIIIRIIRIRITIIMTIKMRTTITIKSFIINLKKFINGPECFF